MLSVKTRFGLIIGWALGIFLLVPAISLLGKQPITAIAMLAASFILLPPIIGFIQKKGNFHLSGGVKFILVVVLIGIATGTMDRSGLVTDSPAMDDGASARGGDVQEQAAAKSYVSVFTFTGNGAKKSEPFTIQVSKFRIRYNCSGDLCQAWLKKPGSQFSIDIIMNGMGPMNDESMFYGKGQYYIESNSLGSYTMVVEDYR